MNVTIYSPGHPSWNSEVEHMGVRLGAPDNPTLFPYHFLSVVLQRIGGHLVQVTHEELLGQGGVYKNLYERQFVPVEG